MKDILTSPNLFLVIIAVAIAWQIINSKELAKEAGQKKTQAWFFSLIMSVSIFICVANGKMTVAIIGVIIETLVNVLLVLKQQHPDRLNLSYAKQLLAELEKKERKGKEIEELLGEIKLIRERVGFLPSFIKLFIGLLIPTVILFMSELYIGGEA